MAKEPKVKVDDRFGKLTVLKKVEIPIMTRVQDESGKVRKEPTGRTKKGWLCKCDCGGEIALTESVLLTERSSLRSCGNCPPEENPNYISNKMTYEESQEWDELYEYVRTNIFGYDKTQSLPSYIVTRLQGLLYGKYMVSNKTKNNANYSYKTVLNTFKFCSSDIHKALRSKGFKDEKHKFNYIAKIIENNINDVYMRMKSVERAKEEAENITINTAIYTGAEYQRKTKDMTNKLLEDLW